MIACTIQGPQTLAQCMVSLTYLVTAVVWVFVKSAHSWAPPEAPMEPHPGGRSTSELSLGSLGWGRCSTGHPSLGAGEEGRPELGLLAAEVRRELLSVEWAIRQSDRTMSAGLTYAWTQQPRGVWGHPFLISCDGEMCHSPLRDAQAQPVPLRLK